MANPSSSSSSSFADQRWSYDVFLSFRGEDTRFGFTGNLYHVLCQKGIKTFMDDPELRKGEEITPALMKAIQESRIAIVIFSEKYASSTFCLQELEKIMECFKHGGRLVWPVFYKVDPCDVRHQKGSYAEALAKHETRISDKDKLKKWRLVLQEAACLSGWHFKQGYEYEFIQGIIQEVSKRINRIPLYVANYPVGLESRVQKVKSLLDAESNDGVHMVGIYGTGGIGKTTLACAVYNFVADQFEGLSFLFDVRENSEKHGLVHLQETLLSDILEEKDIIKLGNVKKGIPIIKSRLCKKKILLILDDVDKLVQLEHLAGELDWFGSGSRIIITTRDKHLLDYYGVERTYEIEELNHAEAVELFSWRAFRGKQVNPSYLDIAMRVIQHSNGLPLSLEIMGSDLCGKTEVAWKSALDAYERTPHKNILEILRVSYDSLQESEKKMFLDMACFFKGYRIGKVINLLHSGYGLDPNYHIQVLIDKCLIKIVSDRVRIHNLIENMGREIVRQESPSKPGKRSRLWDSKDILRVFKKKKGSDKIETIMLDLHNKKEVQWDGTALEKMKNLKILGVKNARFSRGPSALPESLRVLKWTGYPESSLPADFNPKKLVVLDLSQSFFTFKNQSNMKFKSLTELKLSDCQLLKDVPDMSGAPNLKTLQLENCKNLVEVHDSVGFLDKLELLSLCCCTSLRVLPRGLNLTSLKDMTLQNCTSLVSFPEILGKMEKFECLDLGGCKGLLELPSSLFMLSKRFNLNAEYCEQLAQVRNGEGQDQEKMSSMITLANFNRCYLRDKCLATLLPFMYNVTILWLDCSNITILPASISACLSLAGLSLNECKELREIRGLPPNIDWLSAINCTSLTSESKEMLLNLRLHETGDGHFRFPGSAIPSWFNCSSRDPSLRFWFRNKFPAITLCVVGVFGRHFFSFTIPYSSSILSINHEMDSLVSTARDNLVQENHTVLYDLRWETFGDHFPSFLIDENEWHIAEIEFSCDGGRENLEFMGVRVHEQKTNVADILFTEPKSSTVEKHLLIQCNC